MQAAAPEEPRAQAGPRRAAHAADASRPGVYRDANKAFADSDSDDELGLKDSSSDDEYTTDEDGVEDATAEPAAGAGAGAARRRQRSDAKERLSQNLKLADELYDENADDLDEQWMSRRHDETKTDAVLSCPLCFTPVCYDCQQHELYSTQFRAMFAENCHVVHNEILRYGVQPKKPQRGRSAGKAKSSIGDPADGATGHRPQDVYHPVRCDTCDCEIAVFDHEEVYHFFNVIAE
ncbi:hypothetical protein HK105_201175 [Polyrhizophydium stewartii]|uniref:E2F-associated phosphoprotein n=1 Tax=Polyrhizophydium stewartii TaxID=2732419 RepID=A0ABR4NJ18_9FUNG|nr:hypothetical protein HK105_000331 [Polyrhizophydium stewartii]